MTWDQWVAGLAIALAAVTHLGIFLLGKVEGRAETHARLMAAWEASNNSILASWQRSIDARTDQAPSVTPSKGGTE